jgi:hypothetical protein
MGAPAAKGPTPTRPIDLRNASIRPEGFNIITFGNKEWIVLAEPALPCLALGLVGDDAFDGAVKSRNHFAGLRQDENTPESAGSLPALGAGFGELGQQQLLARTRGVGGVRSRVTGRVDSRSPVEERLHSGLNITLGSTGVRIQRGHKLQGLFN